MDNPPAKLDFEEPRVTDTRADRLERFGGMFRNRESIPDTPARKLSEQIVIVDGTAYIYDPANDQYTALGGARTYHGAVEEDGTATALPSGWTAQKNTTGFYTVTHNLGIGITAYIVHATVTSWHNRGIIVADDQTSNLFNVHTFNTTTNADDDAQFVFSLIIHGN